MCIYPEDPCESTSVTSQVSIMLGDAEVIIAPTLALLAVIFAKPFMFTFDYLTIHLQKIKVNPDSAK